MEETTKHEDSIDNRFKSITGFILVPSSFIREFTYYNQRVGEEFFGGRSIDKYVCYGILASAEAVRLYLYLSIIQDVYEKFFH